MSERGGTLLEGRGVRGLMSAVFVSVSKPLLSISTQSEAPVPWFCGFSSSASLHFTLVVQLK